MKKTPTHIDCRPGTLVSAPTPTRNRTSRPKAVQAGFYFGSVGLSTNTLQLDEQFVTCFQGDFFVEGDGTELVGLLSDDAFPQA